MPLLPYLLPTVVVLLALSVYPLVQLVQMALSDVGPTNLVRDWSFTGLANIREAVADPDFWPATRATAIFTVVVLVANLTVGFLAASVLTTTTRTTRFILGLMVFVWALPPLVSGSVWKFMLASDGAVNAVLGLVGIDPVGWLSSPGIALWAVSGVAAWASVPFAALVIRGGIIAIPRDVLDAAAVDGAGYWRMNFSIVLPLLRSTLIVLVVLTILYAFRSFDFVYVMTSGGPGNATATLPFVAYQTAFQAYSFGLGSAIALLSMIAVVVLAVPYILNVRRESEDA